MEVLHAWLFTWNAVLESFTESLILWELFYFTFPLFLLSIFALLRFSKLVLKRALGSFFP